MTNFSGTASRSLRMISLATICCGMLASAGSAQVLYQNVNTAGLTTFNQVEPDFPSSSSGVVDDVAFATAVTVTSITIWSDTSSPSWLTSLTVGRVNVFGWPPAVGDDPTTGAIVALTVSATTINGFNAFSITASGLNINLAPGTYGIGVTPDVSTGIAGTCYTYKTAPIGSSSLWRNPGNGFGMGTGWQTPPWPAADIAMVINGVPEPASLAFLASAFAAVSLSRRRAENRTICRLEVRRG